mgnify:CR=1 FL=1
MITIQPEIEILSTESYEDMLRRIEKIGRVCYKSEDKITEDGESAKKFVRRHCREIHRRHHQTRP